MRPQKRFIGLDQQGFSLIEMIVVMSIVILLASLSLASYNQTNRTADIRFATQQLLGDVQRMQRFALSGESLNQCNIFPGVSCLLDDDCGSVGACVSGACTNTGEARSCTTDADCGQCITVPEAGYAVRFTVGGQYNLFTPDPDPAVVGFDFNPAWEIGADAIAWAGHVTILEILLTDEADVVTSVTSSDVRFVPPSGEIIIDAPNLAYKQIEVVVGSTGSDYTRRLTINRLARKISVQTN